MQVSNTFCHPVGGNLHHNVDSNTGQTFKHRSTGAGDWDLHNWDTNYLIGKLFLFFEAQESGHLRISNRIRWRGSSFTKDEVDGRSLAGGWFNGGGTKSRAFHFTQSCDQTSAEPTFTRSMRETMRTLCSRLFLKRYTHRNTTA